MSVNHIFILTTLFFFFSCSKAKEHTAPAILEKDSVSVMTTYGVNMLVSDSGIIKYRIVTERWDVNTTRIPSRWTFEKGLFMEQFDEMFNTQVYIQSDSAWYYDRKKLWELRGNVVMRNMNGMVFKGNELFWDGIRREIYSNQNSVLVTPDRTLQGDKFISNETMTRYSITNSAGSFVKTNMINNTQ